MENSDKAYFKYLLTRSKLSEWFRLKICYPYVSRYFKGNVLDVGCGIGDYLRYNRNAVGTDINRFNVDYCNNAGYRAYLIQDRQFPFENDFFEGVILDNVLEHLATPDEVINEISRVLKPGGILVVGVPGIKGYTMDSDHKIFYDEEKKRRLLEKNGYHFIKNLYTPLFFKSDFLSRKLSQYAVYGIYQKRN